MATTAGKYILGGVAAVLTTVALANLAAAKASSVYAAEQEIRQSKAAQAAQAAFARERRERAAAAEAAALRRGGAIARPAVGEGDLEHALSLEVRGALGELAAALARRHAANPLLSIPVLGGEGTSFVVLCAALVLGSELAVFDLLSRCFFYSVQGVGGYTLRPGDLSCGLSAERLSRAAAWEVAGFLSRLAGRRELQALPERRSATLPLLLQLREGALAGGHFCLLVKDKDLAEELLLDLAGVPGLHCTPGARVFAVVTHQTTAYALTYNVPVRRVSFALDCQPSSDTPTTLTICPAPQGVLLSSFDPAATEGWGLAEGHLGSVRLSLHSHLQEATQQTTYSFTLSDLPNFLCAPALQLHWPPPPLPPPRRAARRGRNWRAAAEPPPPPPPLARHSPTPTCPPASSRQLRAPWLPAWLLLPWLPQACWMPSLGPPWSTALCWPATLSWARSGTPALAWATLLACQRICGYETAQC